MYFDAITISALVDEFMDELVGGRVQDVIDVDPTGFGFEIYANRQRRYLYLSANKQEPRVHLVGDKLRRGMYKSTQLGLMLRSRVEGSLLTHVSQPPWERILFFDFEHPAYGECRVVLEPMPRRSNLLLLNNQGVILDCVFRIGPGDNSYRLSLPNHEYKLPPPLTDRYDPSEMTVADWDEFLDSSDKPEKDTVAKQVPRKIFGMSPLLGREVVYRAFGEDDIRLADADADSLDDAMRTLYRPLANREWQPGVAGEGDEVEAFSVYPLKSIPNWRAMPSISAAIAEYYSTPTGAEAYDQAKKPVQQALDEGKIRFRKKLESLENSLRDDSDIAELQHSGELILAYQYAIDPGQLELEAQYEVDGPPMQIKLDPDLTPLENAQRYFKKYERAKRAKASVPELIEDTRNNLNYMLQLENDLKMASNWPEIDDVIQQLQAIGLDVIQNKKLKRIGGGNRSVPMRLTHDGYVLWVGRNSKQNEEVTFRKAKSNDLWLHARDVPGAHVVIRDDGRRIPEELIESAAAIAAHYSAMQGEKRADVDVTRCKYVKPIRGAGPGMVTYRNERTLTVVPTDETIFEADED